MADQVESPLDVLVIGQGYVGLVLAVHLAEAGHRVVGVDTSVELVRALGEGVPRIEDITPERLAAALAAGYRPTTSLAEAEAFDAVVISVPTPLAEGIPDLSAVEDAARVAARHVRPGGLVVLESTTWPGTTEEVVLPILRDVRGADDVLVAYSPERIDPGNLVNTLDRTPKVVGGVGEEATRAASRLYGSVVDEVVEVSSPATAELCKVLENTFRHVNIALVNELARFAYDLDVDVWEAIEAASTKPFGFMPFRPGPGVGGHCLPIDPTYLSWRVRRRTGQAFRFVELANDVNDGMPAYVVGRVVELLNDRSLAVRGSSIVVLGYAYKPNTADARETPSAPVIEGLLRLGATVTVVEPHAQQPDGVTVAWAAEATDDLVAGADLVLLLVDHAAFDLVRIAGRARLLFDTRAAVPRGVGEVVRL